MGDAEFDRGLARFRAFLNTEPVVPLLSRNLLFLLDRSRLVETVEVNDGLRCKTEDRRVVVSAAPFLLRDGFDRRHWVAALRVFLAHEVQHDNSSDRLVLLAFCRSCGALLHETYGLADRAGEIAGHRILNILEDARVDNLVCQRFPGYVPMLRFTNYARFAESGAADGGELGAFFKELACYARTGAFLSAGTEERTAARAELQKHLALIDAAVLAQTAGDCAELGRAFFAACAPYLARLCRALPDLHAFLNDLSGTLEDYRFSDTDRAEQRGDGTDAGARKPKKAGEKDGRTGESEDAEEPDLEKGDSGSPGSGDNETRRGDESGSLSGEEVKPKATAGSNGREDRGESLSDGRSNNHGETGRGNGMHNAEDAASEKAREEGPQSIREVLGARFSEQHGTALTDAEIDAMLETAAADLDRERENEKRRRVETGERTPLAVREVNALSALYPNVTFEEKFIEPGTRRLPPEQLQEAKRLHQKLDRILKEQRVRTASQRRGTLSQKALWKAMVNDPDVFERKSPPSKCESVFYLLIDRSGSMGMGYGNGNSKLFTALLTAAVLEEALKGVAFTKIVAFDGGNETVEHVVIKDFSQKEVGSRCCDALDQLAAGNGNKDGYSIRVAAADLAKRSEKRKLLVVLSDGLPSAYSGEAAAIGDVRSAVQDARRKGVAVIPIMYGVTDSEESFASYRQMYEKGIICTSPGNILNEFEKLLFRLLVSA